MRTGEDTQWSFYEVVRVLMLDATDIGWTTMYIIGFIFSSKVPAVIFEILLWPKLFFYDIIIGKNYFSQKISKFLIFSLEILGKICIFAQNNPE